MKNSVNNKNNAGSNSRRYLFILLLFILFPSFLSAGVMYRPRIMHVVKTQHYNILFSEVSARTAKLIADKGDIFYEEALQHLKVKKQKQLPVVISPDSDRFSVEFFASPYPCIVIYEGVPDFSQGDYESALLNNFRNQVYVAVSQRAENIAIVKNLPFSFVQGFAFSEEKFQNTEDFPLKEKEYFSLLVQAKLENNFPTWFQASAQRDVYPGNTLALAAAAGFSGYLIDTYGFEKYLEFWAEAGKLNLFKETQGIFKDIYGIKINEAWKAFEASIPVPENIITLEKEDKLLTELFDQDNQDGFYKFTVNTSYGVVWYDDFRHEVDFCHEFSLFKFREILFWAEDVTNLTVSPDGRFLVLSHINCGTRENFKKDQIEIYDLKRRIFISEGYDLRDGQIVTLEDGKLGVAGIYVDDKVNELRVYKSGKLNQIVFGDNKEKPELVYSKKYPSNIAIQTPVPYANGKIMYLLKEESKVNLMYTNIYTGGEKSWLFDNPTVRNLRIFNLEGNQFCYSFNKDDSFNRIGFINLGQSLEGIITIREQTEDFSGGVNTPVLVKNDIYFCSEKMFHGELLCLPKENFKTDFKFISSSNSFLERKLTVEASEQITGFNLLSDYSQTLYNPLKYQYKGTFLPFVTILDFELFDKIKYWPGLGFTYQTKTDILGNNEFGISASMVYMPLDFTAFMLNLSEAERKEYLSNIPELEENYSFAGYFKNASTPVDILGGTVFKFNNDGQWSWQSIVDLSMELHFRLPLHVMRFNLEFINLAGTEYYDPMQEDLRPSLESWCPYSEAYKTYRLSTAVEYSNVHQYGFSAFEKSGIEAGLTIYSLWDETIIEEEKAADKLAGGDGIVPLISQLNGNIFTTVYIPALNNLKNRDGWVFTAPAVLHLDIMSKTGKAMDVYGEVLLIGKEIQNGFAPVYLYLSRAGLKLGYNASWIYDFDKTGLPDLRDISVFEDILENTSISQNIYLKINLDIVPVIGHFSRYQLKSDMKFAYYPGTNGFLLSFGATVKM